MSKLYTGIELLEAYYNGEINKNTKLKDFDKKGKLIDVKSSVISALSYYRATELVNHTFELIEDETIDIESIKETEIKNDGMKYFEYENNGATESGYSKNYSAGDIETRIKINELVQAVKQLNKEIKSIKEK